MLAICACNGRDAANDDVRTQPVAASPQAIARQLVADFLSVPMAEVTVVSSQAQEFNDSSLGCPEPGMSYMQVLTPGHRVIVEADGRRFDIRVAGGHGKICHRLKSDKEPDKPSDTPSAAALVNMARDDLARLLQTNADQIAVVDVRPHNSLTAEDSCAPNCASEAQCGYMIGLFHDGRRYKYYANEKSVEPCPPLLAM
jgi:hypothetical protein